MTGSYTKKGPGRRHQQGKTRENVNLARWKARYRLALPTLPAYLTFTQWLSQERDRINGTTR